MSVLVTDLKPHLALVTGASGGIGRATCLALANMGCSIAAHYHSSEDKAVALVKELKAKGVRAEAFKADLTKYEEVIYPAITPHFTIIFPIFNYYMNLISHVTIRYMISYSNNYRSAHSTKPSSTPSVHPQFSSTMPVSRLKAASKPSLKSASMNSSIHGEQTADLHFS
jgi:nucleoside-diphosphate-sugar epimerase